MTLLYLRITLDSTESGGPPRKYYKLTELGLETYEADRAEYLDFAKSIRKLLEDEENDEA